MVKLKIITASTRPNRFGPKATAWLMEVAKQYIGSDVAIEAVDLQDVNLPLLDEPNVPMMRQYTQEHTKQWSAIIDEADGFVFVTPEYNYFPPASLVNALDFLWHEWNYKPVTLVGYGTVGGARAFGHLHALMTPFKLFPLREEVRIENQRQFINEQGDFMPSEALEKAAQAMLEQLIFWAGELKISREKLKK